MQTKSDLSLLSWRRLPAYARCAIVATNGATQAQWNNTGTFERWHILKRAFD